MISYDEALKLVVAHQIEPDHERISLKSSLGRCLAEPVSAIHDSPRYDSSAMDGWAVGSESGPWSIVGESAGGSAKKLTLKKGEACRIFTGARVPLCAWGVLAQEDAHAEDGHVTSPGPVGRSSHIRKQGEELTSGDPLLQPGDRVTSATLGVLASQGISRVSVHSPLRVTVISSGNEIVSPGLRLTGSRTYESNSWPLLADLRSFGHRAIHQMVKDEASQVIFALEKAYSTSDLILTIGGISVGDYDLVGPSIEALGGQTLFRGVKIKPGKPVSFGLLPSGCLWFGLPGNPMSCWTTYLLLVRALWGSGPLWRRAVWGESSSRKPGREEFLPVKLVDGESGVVKPIRHVGSHSVSPFSQAHALARIPPEIERIGSGDSVLISFVPGAFA